MHRSAGSSELRYAPSSIEQVSAQESSNDLRSFANRRLFAHVSLPVNNPRCRRAVGDVHSYFIRKGKLFRCRPCVTTRPWQPPGPLTERCVCRDFDHSSMSGVLDSPAYALHNPAKCSTSSRICSRIVSGFTEITNLPRLSTRRVSSGDAIPGNRRTRLSPIHESS